MNNPRGGSLVLLSDNIFTALDGAAHPGFVAIEGNRIAAVGSQEQATPYVQKAEQVIELGARVVCPGFCDVHTFFSGWVLRSIGPDFSGVHSDREGVALIRAALAQAPGALSFLGHGWQPEGFTITDPALLDREFPTLPVVVFDSGCGSCWMNAAARERYGFTPEQCYGEMWWRMMPEYLSAPDMAEKYVAYNRMLNARGVTAIKEIGYDDYYGFADVIAALEAQNRLSVRVDLMSQPVGRGMDIPHGLAMRERFRGDFVRFSGYNRMTDRGIPSFLGELNRPYKSDPSTRCRVPVEWELISAETREADRNGFRYSLHCQGDGAVRHAVALFDSCEKVNGRLKNRHAITDLEFSSPDDLERFGRIGGITEVYAQIQSLDRKQDVLDMIRRQLGEEWGRFYWNRRKMWDSGICVSCGTDLPLLIPDIPQAITCGCGGYFADGEAYNLQNMLTVPEMLMAWTKNGQYNCGSETRLGTLEAGKLADIAVLDRDIFRMPLKDAKDAGVCLTISDGRIVHNTL